MSVPSLRVVKVGAVVPKSLPNYALAPLVASRGLVKIGKTATFETTLHADGFDKNVALPERVSSGPVPSLVALSGTTLGAMDFAQYGGTLLGGNRVAVGRGPAHRCTSAQLRKRT